MHKIDTAHHSLSNSSTWRTVEEIPISQLPVAQAYAVPRFVSVKVSLVSLKEFQRIQILNRERIEESRELTRVKHKKNYKHYNVYKNK